VELTSIPAIRLRGVVLS